MTAPRFLRKITDGFHAWRQRAHEADILRSMSDRDLADLALTRADVERVIAGTYVDPRTKIRRGADRIAA